MAHVIASRVITAQMARTNSTIVRCRCKNHLYRLGNSKRCTSSAMCSHLSTLLGNVQFSTSTTCAMCEPYCCRLDICAFFSVMCGVHSFCYSLLVLYFPLPPAENTHLTVVFVWNVNQNRKKVDLLIAEYVWSISTQRKSLVGGISTKSRFSVSKRLSIRSIDA